MWPSLGAAARPPAWLVCAVCLIGAAYATGPATAVAPTAVSGRPGPQFVVDRPDDALDSASGLTLRAALERAGRDPRDNVIRFDPAVFRAKPAILHIDRPLAYAAASGGRGGRDVIDGGERGVVIQADVSLPAALVVREGGLAIRGVGFSGGGEQTIRVGDEGRVDLADCRVTGSTGAGITLVGRGQLRITGGCIGEHGTHGIEAQGTSSVTVTGAIIERNAQAGLALLHRSRAEVERCVNNGNGRWGIVATNTANAHLVECTIRTAGFANVDVAEQAHVALEACRVLDGVRFGALVSGQARLSARRCEFAANGRRGLELQDDAGAELLDSSVEQSGHFGVVLFGRSKASIEGGSISHNRGHGLTIRDRSTAEIRDCVFDGNECSGVGAPDAGDGGRVSVRRCIFRGNGMRPIFRGPMHIDPPVPIVARIAGDSVVAFAAPRAVIDLYVDRAGEAARYVQTLTADGLGQFTVNTSSLLSGEVITAAATTDDGHTSEFNVVAGRLDGAVLAALLARTGPLSDGGGDISPAAPIQRWRPGTRLAFLFEEAPPPPVEAYARWFAATAREWLGGAIEVDVQFGLRAARANGLVLVPIRYASADDPGLNGSAGTAFTQWNPVGYFDGPVRILLARPAPGEDACPRVAVHEMCHALGLYHARVGLLSRMQGVLAPPPGQVNDFAPAPTFFDVAALRALYGNTLKAPTTLGQLAEAGVIPVAAAHRVAAAGQPPATIDTSSIRETTSVLSAPRASRR